MINFSNDGFGWICKRCDAEFEAQKPREVQQHSRLFREGEAESKQPKLSNLALAKWQNAERSTLVCPTCGIVEKVDNA